MAIESSAIQDGVRSANATIQKALKKDKAKTMNRLQEVIELSAEASMSIQMSELHWAALTAYICLKFPMWKFVDILAFIKFASEQKSYGKKDIDFMKQMCGEYNMLREDERVRMKRENRDSGGERSAHDPNTLDNWLKGI